MLRISVIAFAFASLATKAFAHVGHLGDVASHAHWAGIAAIAGAVALGALAGKLNKKAKEDAASDDEIADDALEGEAA